VAAHSALLQQIEGPAFANAVDAGHALTLDEATHEVLASP
jgi:hypothetical protein